MKLIELSPSQTSSLNQSVGPLALVDLAPISRDMIRIKDFPDLFADKDEKKLIEALNSIESDYDFFKKVKHKWFLKWLYQQGRNYTFIAAFNEMPVSDRDLLASMTRCLVETKEADKAFALFKSSFNSEKIDFWRKYLDEKSLRLFLNRLDFNFWLEKGMVLLRIRDYREFRREKEFINNLPLKQWLEAEFLYQQKKFSQARQQLVKIKDDQLFPYIKKLFIRLNLRSDIMFDPTLDMNMIKVFPDIYFKMLDEISGIYLLNDDLDSVATIYREYLLMVESLTGGVSKKVSLNRYWEILWQAAWVEIKRNNKPQALEYFKKGIEAPLLSYRIAIQYWLYKYGVITADVIKSYPYSYYYTRLKEAGNVNIRLSPSRLLLNRKLSPVCQQIMNDIYILLHDGLLEESCEFISGIRNEPGLTTMDFEFLSLVQSILYLKRDDFYQAFKAFRLNFPLYQKLQLPRYLASIIFPVKYRSLIEDASKQFAVDPCLIFALIRQESFFQHDSVSAASARGLTQLLYSTARLMGRQYKINVQSTSHLYNPEINIFLGVAYFKKLLDHYNGKVHLALAAYNAGESRVNRWRQNWAGWSDEEFIEMIPFSETRNYVKSVLLHYYYYKFYYRR